MRNWHKKPMLKSIGVSNLILPPIMVAVQLNILMPVGTPTSMVEAMKMENELKAPKDGTIQEIFGAVGDAVDGGAPLCVIE